MTFTSKTHQKKSPKRESSKSEHDLKTSANKSSTYVPKPLLSRRIDQVRDVLNEALQWVSPADVVLSYWFKRHPKLGGRDRGEIAEAVYHVLRHLRYYRHITQSGVGNVSRRLAILGLNATLNNNPDWSKILTEEEQSWLAHMQTISAENLSPAVRYSLPDWLFEALSECSNPQDLMAAMLLPAAFDARVNPFKMEREELFQTLRAMNLSMEFSATPYSPYGIRFAGHPNIHKWPLFLEGKIEVQDEGSQLLSLLVAPKRGELVIDFCAGAGGKTLMLGALMRSTGRLYAFDVSEKRLANLKPRVARSGLSNVMTFLIEHENDTRVKRVHGKAQRVLVDAPCSGLGTLRRNPDLKWRQQPESLGELAALQARILNSAAKCVAPKGRLVYATCSVLRQENQAQVEAFLATHPEFTLKPVSEVLTGRLTDEQVADLVEGDYLVLRPDQHNTDGFFAAVLERTA